MGMGKNSLCIYNTHMCIFLYLYIVQQRRLEMAECGEWGGTWLLFWLLQVLTHFPALPQWIHPRFPSRAPLPPRPLLPSVLSPPLPRGFPTVPAK